MAGYMATQVDIINSDRVAQRVVKMLKLDENPAAKEQWLEATEGKGTLEMWLANRLQKKLDRQALARKQRHQYRLHGQRTRLCCGRGQCLRAGLSWKPPSN